MAGGFWSGLLHGSVICVVALAGLSLMAPRTAVVSQPDSRVEKPASPPPPQDRPDRPAASDIDLPAGSEFGRAGDLPPQSPQPLIAPAGRLDQTEAPAVTPPEAEPAPLAVNDPVARPHADDGIGADQGPTQPAVAQGEARADFTRPSASLAPAAQDGPAAPSFAAPDVLPDTYPVASPAAEPEPTDVLPIAPSQTPGLSRPALDLSTPPDLSDLKELDRN